MFSLQRRAPLRAIPAILLILLSSLPASASVTCMVRRHGQFVCTFFCQNGFICDDANMRCLPGQQILQNLSKLQEESRQATLVYNRYRLSAQRQANSQSTGYDLGSTYYNWDGDPREIPTPRHRQGGGLSSNGTSSSTSSGAPVKQYTVRPAVKSQLLALLVAARSFAATDPNRAGAIKLLRKFVRDNKVPVDVDTLLDCDKPRIDSADQLRSYQLRWGLADIQPEIEKRGLCAQAKNDDERQACEAYQFGQVVMIVEPELKALCKLQENDPQEKDPEALGECAENKFRNAWASRGGKTLVQASGTSVADAQKCPVIAADTLDDLRNRLRKALAEANVGDSDDAAPDQPPPADKQQPVEATPKPEVAADNSDDEDPFCAFIARRAVRGELTPGGGDKIPEYCRKALDAAKACAEQKCSMADVIDEQERKNAPRTLPWGSDDYRAIDALAR